MSAAIPVTAARPVSRATRGWAMLRATGPAGIASAIVIAVATFMAIFGTFIALYDPITPNLSLAWVGPVGGGRPARVRLRGARRAVPGLLWGRGHRCSGRWRSLWAA